MPPAASSSNPDLLQTEVHAYQADHLRKLADQPHTTVLKPEYDLLHDPWPVERLKALMERLVGRVLGFGDEVDDFRVRKDCLDDEDFLAFQREHPKSYWMLTDRKLMRDPRTRSAITGLLHVRMQVESGAVAEGQDADGMATRTVLAALGAQHVKDAS